MAKKTKSAVGSPKGPSSKVKKMAGVVKLPNDFDEKKELTSYFENKHL